MTQLQLGGSEIDDSKSFWKAVGQRAIGVSVVTAMGPAGPAGFLCLSIAHVSATPPLISISIDKRTNALTTVLEARHFAINFLAEGSETLANQFSGKAGTRGVERFAQSVWGVLTTGAPILHDCVGAIDCELKASFEQEAAVLVLGRAVRYVGRLDRQPLLMFRGEFATILKGTS